MKKAVRILSTLVLFLGTTELWIPAAPYALFFTGAALNQLGLIANHDKFPTMMNAKQVAAHRANGDLKEGQGDLYDDIHCLMSSKTHLNFLGDIFDFQSVYESIGDLLIDLANATRWYALVVWMVLASKRLWRQRGQANGGS